MKLSFFKTPKPQRFHIVARHYDEVKEDIANRTQRIKAELEEQGPEKFKSNLAGAFSRRGRQNKQSSIIQLSLIIFFLTFSFGYLYYGNDIFYALLILIPIYLFFKIRRMRS